MEQFIWTADSNSVQQHYPAKAAAAALSILFSLCLQFPELSLCANTTAELTDDVQHVKPAGCLSRRLCA